MNVSTGKQNYIRHQDGYFSALIEFTVDTVDEEHDTSFKQSEGLDTPQETLRFIEQRI